MITRKGSIDFTYFTKGDYVNSPEGSGIVVEDEKIINNERDFYYSEIKVQYKEASSGNPSNEVREVERQNLFRITKEEYDGDFID